VTLQLTQGQWETNASAAHVVLASFFTNKDDSPAAYNRAKLANGFLGHYSRHEATESSRETTRLIIGRHLSENREQFREFMSLTLPNIPLPTPLEALPEPAKQSRTK